MAILTIKQMIDKLSTISEAVTSENAVILPHASIRYNSRKELIVLINGVYRNTYYKSKALLELIYDNYFPTDPSTISFGELEKRFQTDQISYSPITSKVLNYYFKEGTQEQKTRCQEFMRMYGHEKCELTGNYYPQFTISSPYLNGRYTNVHYDTFLQKLRNGEILDEEGTYVSVGGTSFYEVAGQRRSLLWIIDNADNIEECSCHSLIFRGSICQTCYPGVGIEDIYLQYTARATSKFSFKALPEEKKKKEKPLYLGVELELENRTTQNLLMTHKLLKEHAIIKRDGSVSEGLEICSAPATLNVHKKEFKPFFDNINKLGLKPKTNCGMHVHVDKSNLTQLQIGKMLGFLNNESNKNLLELIAGRKANTYCKITPSFKPTTGVFYDSTDRKLKRNFSDRYTALNLCPSATIEFRIFASTNKYSIFIKNLEFVKSVVDYTAPCRTNLTLKDTFKKESYLDFLKKNKTDYPELADFLKTKEVL